MSNFVLTPAAEDDLVEILGYLAGPDTKPVQIVRILHGRRDIRRLMEE